MFNVLERLCNKLVPLIKYAVAAVDGGSLTIFFLSLEVNNTKKNAACDVTEKLQSWKLKAAALHLTDTKHGHWRLLPYTLHKRLLTESVITHGLYLGSVERPPYTSLHVNCYYRND